MIRRATKDDATVIAQLAVKMWDGHSVPELAAEMEQLLTQENAAIFLHMEQDQAVGFAQCQLRRDYVEGTSTSPVGYLEGVFVEEAFQGRGYARQLVTACEEWAKEQGCTEFASDCELSNTASLAFHLHTGFTVANRIICFTKKL